MGMTPGVILAGGLSRRMGGGDKGLLPLGETTLLGHVVARLSRQADPIALNANGDPGRFADFRVPVIADSAPDRPGPLAGILAALDWAAGRGATHAVTVAADTPFFPGDLVDRLALAAHAQGRPIALAATPDGRGGVSRHPTFGLWPVVLRDDLRAALARGVRRVSAWADGHGAALASFPVDDGDPFFNVNTPDDLDRARGMTR